MKNILAVLVLLSASALYVHSDPDIILKKMISESDAIVHAKILKVEGGLDGGPGRTYWNARCQVIASYKGDIRVEQPFRLYFVRRAYPIIEGKKVVKEIPEPLMVETNREYILFLKTSTNRIGRGDEPEYAYQFTDHSLGSQHYEKNLARLVEFHAKSESAVSKQRAKTDADVGK